jgi:hypothetical protein
MNEASTAMAMHATCSDEFATTARKQEVNYQLCNKSLFYYVLDAYNVSHSSAVLRNTSKECFENS